jgi:hypothetical protein
MQDDDAPLAIISPANLAVAAFRAVAVTLVMLWSTILVVSLDRWKGDGPSIAPALVFSAVGALALFGVTMWQALRTRGAAQGRPWLPHALATAFALALGPLVALARATSPTNAFVCLVAALAVGAVFAGFVLVERATLARAVRLRARLLGATLIGLLASGGLLAVILQIQFTEETLQGGLDAGYERMGRSVSQLGPEALVALAPIGCAAGLVAWARLCHLRVWRQLASALALSWITPAIALLFINVRPAEAWKAALIAWAILGAGPVVVVPPALRLLEALELRVLRVGRIPPRPLLEGSFGRTLIVLFSVALALMLGVQAVTLVYARAVARELDALAAAGVPVRAADLPAPAPGDDAMADCRALLEGDRFQPLDRELHAAQWRVGGRRTLTPDEREARLAQVEQALRRFRARRAELERAAARSGASFVPEDDVRTCARIDELLEASFYARLARDDARGAVDDLLLRRRLYASFAPELGWVQRLGGEDAACRWAVDLVAQAEPSAEDCRRALAELTRSLSAGMCRGRIRGVRIGAVRSREGDGDPGAGSMLARAGWSRDRQLLLTLGYAARAEAAVIAGTPPPVEVRPSWIMSPEAHQMMVLLEDAPRSLAVSEARRRLACLALALRLHRLETGAYPMTLAALVPAYLAEVPVEPRTGAPFVYARTASGFQLTPSPDGRNGLVVER